MVRGSMGGAAIGRHVRVASIFVALAALSSCGGGKAISDTFSLSATHEVAGPSAKGRQILIPEPTALKAIDSEQIVIRVAPAEIQYLGKARWSDRLPKIVQSKLVEAFENSRKLGGVGRPGEGLAIDYQVVSDIRAFEIQASGGSHAHVEISVKLLNDRNGTVRAQRVFTADVPVSGSDNPSFVAGLDAAFSRVTTDIVGWTLKSI
jgi:cholesterol transport system auxiliary component